MDSISALSWLGIGQKLRGTERTRGLPGLSHGVFSLRQFQLLGELIPGMKSGDCMHLHTYTFLRFVTHNLVAVLFELAFSDSRAQLPALPVWYTTSGHNPHPVMHHGVSTIYRGQWVLPVSNCRQVGSSRNAMLCSFCLWEKKKELLGHTKRVMSLAGGDFPWIRLN